MLSTFFATVSEIHDEWEGKLNIYIDNKDLDQKRAAGREQQLGHGGKSRGGVGVFSE
jgi:hypothetical protein